MIDDLYAPARGGYHDDAYFIAGGKGQPGQGWYILACDGRTRGPYQTKQEARDRADGVSVEMHGCVE